MVDKNAVEDFLLAIQPQDKKTDTTYNATVTRVDDNNMVWVQVAGSDKETPTESTSSEVKRGDAVNVQWRNNKLYIAGNYTNPAAGTIRVAAVESAARVANQAATNAVADAGVARQAAEDAQTAATQAQSEAATAKNAADNASEYAARALGNLSTVQSVTETLNWITQHGTMALTTDVALDPTHVYFVQDAGGDYVVGGVTYAVVTEPDVADIGTYYELSIDESLNNYVGTHLALTSEGLWLIPEAGGNRVLIATGGVGHTYEDAGTYIIDENDNISAQFLEDGTTIYGPSNTLIAHLGYGQGYNQSGQLVDAPFYTLGERVGNVGNYSVATGKNITSSGAWSFAEGINTESSGTATHAEGAGTIASSDVAHAEGGNTIASGGYSHAQNHDTIAQGFCQTVIGDLNIPSGSAYSKSNTDYALIIGNGYFDTVTLQDVRSNALTVDWLGNLKTLGSLFTGMADEWAKGSGTNHIIIAGYHVCWGVETITLTTANTYQEQEVTLPYTYTSAPTCFATCANRAARERTAYASQGGLALNKIYVGVYGTSITNPTYYVSWMTIGK